MLKLSKGAAPLETERFLENLASSDNAPTTLLMPLTLRGIEIGGEAASIQAIISWSRLSPDSTVKLYAGVQELTAHTFNAPHLLAAVLMARRVIDHKGEDITLRSRKVVNNRIAVLGRSSFAGRRFPLIAADHTTEQFPTSLYQNRFRFKEDSIPDVKDLAGFESLIKNSLARSNEPSAKRILSSKVAQISDLVRELFENTHLHARTDHDRVKELHPSIRMISFRDTQSTLRNLTRSGNDESTLRSFLSHESHEDLFRVSPRFTDMRRFLEINVVDSGIGLPERARTESALRDLDDTEATFWCMSRGTTTTASASRGLGLDNVQDLMSELRGYMRIRTGTIELTRDFASYPRMPGPTEVNAAPGEWNVRRDLATVAGTLVTLVIPTAGGARQS